MNNQIQLVLKSSTTELSLNDRELGIYLTPELDGLTGLPEIRTTSGVNAGYDGGWTSAQNYDARSITIRGVIANEDVATVEQLRRQLTTLAGQGKNEELTLDLVTQAGKAYTIQVRTIALEMSLQKVLTQQEFMLQLRADDPLIYDASETGHEALLQVAQATGGFTIDFELPLAITGSSEETVVNNEGLEQVPTITRMYGELHNPKIINQTTNQFMQIEADLGFAEGDWIEPSEVVSGKDITINGAPEGAPFSKLDLKGNTSQQTYTGKNLFEPSVVADGTVSGVTFSHSTDGSLINITTGSGSSSAAIDRMIHTALSDIPSSLIESGSTYTLSTTTPLPNGVRVAVLAYSATSWVADLALLQGNGSRTSSSAVVTIPSTATRIRWGVHIDSGISFNLQNLGIQFEKNSSATSFEPYVGGTPAPNPDYPQAVKVVTGENVVKIRGKNLLKLPSAGTDAGVTYSINSDGTFNIHGTNNSGYEILFSLYLDSGEFQSVDYTLGAREALPYGLGCRCEIYRGGTWKRSFVSVNYTRQTQTGTPDFTDANRVRVAIAIANGATVNIDNVGIQLEKGSSASSFKPYQGQSYPISLGTLELCKIGDYQDSIYKSGGKWYLRKEIGHTLYTGNVLGIAANQGSGETTVSATGAFFIWVGDAGLMSENLGTLNNGAISGNADANAMTSGTFATRSGAPDRLYFRNTAYIGKTGNEMKAILASNSGGASIWYALATPTDTEITNEALIEQLEALAAATMYNPQTNITTLYADGNEQPTLDVSYFTDKNPDTRDELVIDSRLRTITLNGLDVYHLQAPGSEFLMLAPGENRLALQSDITGDNGYAQVSYKQGYLSI